jgi:hypothetical protein
LLTVLVTLALEPAAPVVTLPTAMVVACGPVSPCGPRSPTLVTVTVAVPPFVIVGVVPVDPATATVIVLPAPTETLTSLPPAMRLSGVSD